MAAPRSVGHDGQLDEPLAGWSVPFQAASLDQWLEPGRRPIVKPDFEATGGKVGRRGASTVSGSEDGDGADRHSAATPEPGTRRPCPGQAPPRVPGRFGTSRHPSRYSNGLGDDVVEIHLPRQLRGLIVPQGRDREDAGLGHGRRRRDEVEICRIADAGLVRAVHVQRQARRLGDGARPSSPSTVRQAWSCRARSCPRPAVRRSRARPVASTRSRRP